MEEKNKSKVVRSPNRAVYEKDKIYELLDKEFFCHVGFIHKASPVVIPTMYGRKDDNLYIHGASVSRLIVELERGIDVCISIANVSGIVLARSLFNHSLNYESVVIFGLAELVSDEEKENSLKIISDHMLSGRWEEGRKPNQKELKATKVLKITIKEMSAKIREGDPSDDDEDYSLDIWAGVLPILKTFGEPIPDSKLNKNLNVSDSIIKAKSN